MTGDGASAQEGDLPPAGFGTLKQEDIAIRLETPSLQIRVLPLDERVIRLMAPDTYQGLRALKGLKAAEVDSVARRRAMQEPTLFVVMFFARVDQAEFYPDDLTVTSRNRFFRPIAVLPLTPGWGEQRLGLRETATAVYVFDSNAFVLEPLQISYAGVTSRSWEERILRLLDEERAAVLARAASQRPGRP